MPDQPVRIVSANNVLHPRHPGKGQPTSLIALESDEPSVGGVLFFFPSGSDVSFHWQQVTPVYPIDGAASQFCADVVRKMAEAANDLERRGMHDKAAIVRADINGTNWDSVVHGVALIIREFNARLTTAVAAKLVAERGEAGPGAEVVPYH